MLLATLSAAGQTFNLNVAFKSTPKGKVTLSIYDGDTTPRIMRKKVSKDMASFDGQVEHPCYAEVSTTKGLRMGFFLENSDINVRFNEDVPESSQITGSRTNSQFRYALEQSRETDGSYNIAKLAEQVTENKSTVYAPLLIYRYIIPRCDMERVGELTDSLEGDAKNTYHYQLLKSQLQSLNNPPSDKLPDVVFVDAKHNKQHIDSLLSDSSYNLILVGATWCKQCEEARKMAVQTPEKLNFIVINIDDDKKLWDAEIVKKLQIEHIPYLILIDKKKKIVAQDIRPWEIGRRIRR